MTCLTGVAVPESVSVSGPSSTSSSQESAGCAFFCLGADFALSEMLSLSRDDDRVREDVEAITGELRLVYRCEQGTYPGIIQERLEVWNQIFHCLDSVLRSRPGFSGVGKSKDLSCWK